MPLSQKLKIVAVTSLVWSSLFACAGTPVKWWFLDGRDEMALIRRDKAGKVKERLSFMEADGKWCADHNDAEFLIACCEARGQ